MFTKIRNIPDIIRIWRKPRRDIPPMIKAAEKAKQEWLYAQRMYLAAVEPELIDYTSYLIKAYEIKYIYLLRQIKQEGLLLSPTDMEIFHG